ncbi:hypothetical protein ACTMTJ_15880 [Phytohabitans sp. LJ34]|uniref:hypothetical protein n=1 Tax=Phytohabitans sp. LJ34 TaxID=3452217 RepID=UPI003F8B8246
MMVVEERISRILAEMAEDLRPLPDPYQRARAGLRRRRRRQLMGLGLAAVTLLSATGAVVAGGSARRVDETAVREPDPGWPQVVEWARRLADSPRRGAVAADRGYVAAVEGKLLEDHRRGSIGPAGTALSNVRVLFADDVGDHRVALVALVRADPAPNEWPAAATWLVAPKGTGAAELASSVRGVSDALEPYMTLREQGYYVGIAPAGCEFASAAWPLVKDWKDEPTGSYLVRTGATLRPEWWRVTCGGLVKEMTPGPGGLHGQSLMDANMAELAASARRGPVPAAWREAIFNFASGVGYEVTALPRAIWAGRITGTVPGLDGSYDGQAKVVAAPAVGGGWIGEVQITYDHVNPVTNSVGTAIRFTVSGFDPTDPDTTVAVPLGDRDKARSILVIAPRGASHIVAYRSEGPLATAPVVDGAAVLPVPASADVGVRALTPSGENLAFVPPGDWMRPSLAVSSWGL